MVGAPPAAAPGFSAGPAPQGFAGPQGFAAPQGYGSPTQVGGYYGAGQAGGAESSGSTNGWAISAVVLGALLALLNLIGLLTHGNVVSGLSLLFNACFIAGGIGVMGRHNWGRVTLMVASCIGMAWGALILVGGLIAGPLILSAINSNPSVAAAFSRGYANSHAGMTGQFGQPGGFGQAPNMPDPHAMVGVGVTVLVVFCVIFAGIFIGYNVPLFLNMKSQRTRAAMID